MTPLKFSEE